MKYTELKRIRDDKYNEINDKYGVFYAFSMKQFAEGQKENPLNKGEKYVSMGMGGYIRKSHLEGYLEGIKAIEDWFKVEHRNINQDEAILYELNNYECFYSGDISTALEVLKEQGITKEQVQAVYKKNYQFTD